MIIIIEFPPDVCSGSRRTLGRRRRREKYDRNTRKRQVRAEWFSCFRHRVQRRFVTNYSRTPSRLIITIRVRFMLNAWQRANARKRAKNVGSKRTTAATRSRTHLELGINDIVVPRGPNVRGNSAIFPRVLERVLYKQCDRRDGKRTVVVVSRVGNESDEFRIRKLKITDYILLF